MLKKLKNKRDTLIFVEELKFKRISKGFFNSDATKAERQEQQTMPYFWPLFWQLSSARFAIS